MSKHPNLQRGPARAPREERLAANLLLRVRLSDPHTAIAAAAYRLARAARDADAPGRGPGGPDAAPVGPAPWRPSVHVRPRSIVRAR